MSIQPQLVSESNPLKFRFLWTDIVSLQLLNVPDSVDAITLVGRTNYRKVEHLSFGWYRAPQHYKAGDCTLRLGSQACLGGTYCGVQSEGLFSTLKPRGDEREGARLICRPADELIPVHITAYRGFVKSEEILSRQVNSDMEERRFCEVVIERTCLDPELVERVEVEVGRIRGALFIPRGPLQNGTSTFHGVVDLFGYGGGLLEHRGALLAAEGFLVLSLAFFNYSDLPKTMEILDMDYFEEGVDFLLSHPAVNGTRVSALGLSKGSEIVVLMAAMMPTKIAGVVPINGPAYTTLNAVKYRGKVTPPTVTSYEMRHFEKTHVGVSFRRFFSSYDLIEDGVMPVELCDPQTRFLFVHCGGDLSTDYNHAELLVDRLRLAGKQSQASVLRLAGAGHLLDPPYLPLCRKGALAHVKMPVDYGGETFDHSQAQMEFWQQLLVFLRAQSKQAAEK